MGGEGGKALRKDQRAKEKDAECMQTFRVFCTYLLFSDALSMAASRLWMTTTGPLSIRAEIVPVSTLILAIGS